MNGINVAQLRDLIIRPTLDALGMYSKAAEQLLLGTACHESECGQWLKQRWGGPALGIYQMEPATHGDILNNWLMHNADLYGRVMRVIGDGRFSADRLVYDLRYATVFCRLHYRRRPEPLPEAGDWPAIAAYHKRFYNTVLGKSTPEKFLAAVYRFELDRIA
ncbi:hypothetical protein [Methylocaldum gracile]|jgi:DNA-binding transcriptional regulator YdaS (Cro superfamily)|uniref:hypothetical protein n=1 Tax=Methylocaldum sp. 0917 TaxID=2485163 RepID=UPI0010E3C089